MADNLAVIEAFSQAALSGDLEKLRTLLHPDFEVHEAASLPYGGVYRGLDGFLEMFAGMQAAWGGPEISQIGVIGERTGNQFALHMQVKGTAASGESITSEVFERWVVRDGMIAQIHPFYWDTALLAEQLGTPDA